ncbi:hypothetical protein [Idiomarina aminovorans]|uniref:hypothetical protein n=1 Tax=Idiomarina aminovorans TaxID=2914829 RepID=UPI002004DA3C|nr:hypothetical protein [Idiomarina sp. ATCH4]MCK7459435.1 hypothetical protein [Idiomarina sp. ATCH4]
MHFNYQEGFIALMKNNRFSYKTDIDRSGLVLEPHRLGALIEQVAEDSHAAELGITAPAIMKEINGKKNNGKQLR